MADEIVPGLYVGDLRDARQLHAEPGWRVLSVIEQSPTLPNTTWIPIKWTGSAFAQPEQLSAAAEIISAWLATGRNVLVHCATGVERSPLTVAWYLQAKCEMTLDEAYELLTHKRPAVQDRRRWLTPR